MDRWPPFSLSMTRTRKSRAPLKQCRELVNSPWLPPNARGHAPEEWHIPKNVGQAFLPVLFPGPHLRGCHLSKRRKERPTLYRTIPRSRFEYSGPPTTGYYLTAFQADEPISQAVIQSCRSFHSTPFAGGPREPPPTYKLYQLPVELYRLPKVAQHAQQRASWRWPFLHSNAPEAWFR